MTELPPESAHDAFRACFKAGDLEGILALYEDHAALVQGDGKTTTGKAAVRDMMAGFLALGGDFELTTRYAVRMGELALLSNRWTLRGTGRDGQTLDMSGQTTEVVRRQADGRWLYVIDHPWGAQ
jgi:uncharacterized protein (TIGR02246 family)